MSYFEKRTGCDILSGQCNLTERLTDIKKQWRVACNNFNYLTEVDKIDCCIYAIKSLELEYNIVLREMKKNRAAESIVSEYE